MHALLPVDKRNIFEVRIISIASYVQKLLKKAVLLFEVVDLTSKVNSKPKVFQMYAIGLVSSLASGSFFPRSSVSVRTERPGFQLEIDMDEVCKIHIHPYPSTKK